MSSSSQPSVEAIAVAGATVIPWSRLPGAAVVDVGRPTGGAPIGEIELPGPRTRPVRPQLELAASPAGLAARVIQGDGAAAALAIRNDEVIALPAAPLAVAARSDGIWALYRDGLIDHDRHGAVRRKLALSGVALIGAAGDAVWLAASDQAWHIDAAGAIHGPVAWRDPLTAFAAGDRLCARDRRDPRALVCIAPGGATAPVALAVALAPLEHPIALDADRLITLQGTTVRVRRGGDLVAEWTLQVAGVDAARAGFAVTATTGATAGQVALWRPAAGATSPVARRFAAPGPGSLSAASVDGDAVTLYGQGRAVTQRTAAAPAIPTAIDEAAYRAAIFPAAWEMAPVHGIAARGDGSIAVAASGPTGAAVIELRPAHAAH
ncbi:MAG TPA: hypothetical protein VK601_31480 [Kofleriaceae bacterium]|nr:hypothetical protein [Kofleriaceae bacterium]